MTLTRSTALKPRRTRKCAVKGCATRFQPRNMMHKCCGAECAEIFAAAERKRLDAKQTRDRKQAMKTRSDWLKEAQAAFNAYIRARDEGQQCISCGTSLKYEAIGGGFDCGHYRSVGSAPHLRFHEDNAHGQCKKCNRYGSGMAVDYRLNLIARIGLDRVEALESDQTPRHYAIDDLKQIKATYKAKLKALKAAPPAVTYSETDDFTDVPEPELPSIYEETP